MKDIFNGIFLEAYLTFDFTCRFITPENVPIQYGVLSRSKDVDFGPHKPAAEFSIRVGEKINLEIEGLEIMYVNNCSSLQTL